MNIADIVNLVNEEVEARGISPAFIVGGVPRAIISYEEGFNDIDITTGDDTIFILAKAVADRLGKKIKRLNSGGNRIVADDLCLDFSSNYYYDNIDDFLEQNNLPLTNLNRETFSRDFTVNTLLIPFANLTKVLDLTTLGISDIKEKILRCPLDMDLSFKSVPSRMLRALHMHVCKGYGLSDEMLASIVTNAELLKTIDSHYAGHLLNDIVRTQPEFLEVMLELGIIHNLPLTKFIVKELVEQKGLIRIL